MPINPFFLPPQSPLVTAAAARAGQTQRTIRAVTGYGISGVDVTAGELCSITSFRKDFDDTHITALNFVTVASNLITLTKPGYYLVTYHTALSIAIVESETVNPSSTVGKTILKAGSLELEGTAGYVTAPEIPNLNGFLKCDSEGPLEVTVDVSGATGKTNAITKTSVAVCEASGTGSVDEYGVVSITLTGPCTDVLTAAELDAENKLDITLDTQTPLDCAINAELVTTESTESNAIGTASGTALVAVKYNADGDLKIFVGASQYSPTIGVFGIRDSGVTPVFALQTSISIIKLF